MIKSYFRFNLAVRFTCLPRSDGHYAWDASQTFFPRKIPPSPPPWKIFKILVHVFIGNLHKKHTYKKVYLKQTWCINKAVYTNFEDFTIKQLKMSDFFKIYCVWDEWSLLYFHVADLAVFRRSFVGSNWWGGMSLASLAVRILDNVHLGIRLGQKAVLFLRIIEKIRGVIRWHYVMITEKMHWQIPTHHFAL